MPNVWGSTLSSRSAPGGECECAAVWRPGGARESDARVSGNARTDDLPLARPVRTHEIDPEAPCVGHLPEVRGRQCQSSTVEPRNQPPLIGPVGVHRPQRPAAWERVSIEADPVRFERSSLLDTGARGACSSPATRANTTGAMNLFPHTRAVSDAQPTWLAACHRPRDVTRLQPFALPPDVLL